LGIADSPQTSKATMQACSNDANYKSPPMQPVQSTLAEHSGHSPPKCQLSPKSATIQHATTVLFEAFATLEDSATDPSLCVYGQPIQLNFQKLPIPTSPIRPAPWSSVQEHPLPDTAIVDMFTHWLSIANIQDETRCSMIPLSVSITETFLKKMQRAYLY
jgi:hypothetical protein